MKYILVWQPEYTNNLTVSFVKYEEGMLIKDIMALAHEVEGLSVDDTGYGLYEILKATDPEVVVTWLT